MKSTLASAAFILALVVAGHTLPAAEPRIGQPPVPSPEAGSETGPDLFVWHCALCHGLDGCGHGPLAEAMKIVPADLTKISARHNGEFPAAKVADIIRNGGGVLGHGSSAMLAWGLYFSEKHKPEIAKARIAALVSYLRTLQEK